MNCDYTLNEDVHSIPFKFVFKTKKALLAVLCERSSATSSSHTVGLTSLRLLNSPMISEEEDLWEDVGAEPYVQPKTKVKNPNQDPWTSTQALSHGPTSSGIKASSQSNVRKTRESHKILFEKSSVSYTPGCVLCYEKTSRLSQCQKCYLRMCLTCAQRDNPSQSSRPWLCLDCSRGVGGLQSLLDGNHQPKTSKTSSRATSGTTTKRKVSARRFSKKRHTKSIN